jgi:NhaP-type Na+/H+ or K+/H+ antiporter
MTAGEAVTETLREVLGAVVLGVAAGWLAGRALRLGQSHGSTERGPMLLLTILLALMVLGLSGTFELDGVLTAFVAGLAFNRSSTGGERKVEVELDEAVNRFVVLPFFVLIGATIPWDVWQELGWPAVVLALAVLLFRRLPVLLLLKGPLRLGWADAAFLGWFGPIGVSAVFYLVLVAREVGASATVTGAGMMIVVASTVVHGLSSSPGRVLYQRLTERQQPDDEHEQEQEHEHDRVQEQEQEREQPHPSVNR